jgi:hypothetical protein
MLVTSNTIAESLLANITELSPIRASWTPKYAEGLKTNINNAVSECLGLDAKKVLRSATVEVNAIHEQAIRDLAFLKQQLEVDFAKDKTTLAEILKTLGFNQHLSKVQKGNHEALINLLKNFTTNMSANMRQSIIEKGTNPQLLDRIVGYAVTFTEAEFKQESFKGSTKELPVANVEKLNVIYEEVIGICKIASKYYLRNSIKKEQFTFSHVLGKISNRSKKTKDTPETA